MSKDSVTKKDPLEGYSAWCFNAAVSVDMDIPFEPDIEEIIHPSWTHAFNDESDWANKEYRAMITR